MKKYTYFLLACFVFCMVGCDVDTDISESKFSLDNYELFNSEDVVDLELIVSVDEWNQLLQNYDSNPDNEEYVRCGFTAVKGDKNISIDSCGLRLKGNTSRRRPEGVRGELHDTEDPDWHHASFSVKFNKYVKGQKFNGRERIHLKWFKDDPAYVREVYCYDLFHKFGVWTAPKSGYCKLTIKIEGDTKPAYFGVYELLETVDKEYLKERIDSIGDTNGFLWKASYGADLKTADYSKMGVENITLSQTYVPVYDLKLNEDQLQTAKNQLYQFITDLNSKTGDDFKNWISQKMDIPLFLKTYSVSVMCGMWDDYWCNKNNFYFYFNSQGKFYFIPYDYDNTLGTSFLMTDAGRQDLLNWGNNSYPLVKKIISIPEYNALYKSYLKQLIDPAKDLFYVDASVIRIKNWQSMISNYIVNDTNEDMQIADAPASWGNCSFYRLLNQNTNNFFVIKASVVPD